MAEDISKHVSVEVVQSNNEESWCTKSQINFLKNFIIKWWVQYCHIINYDLYFPLFLNFILYFILSFDF